MSKRSIGILLLLAIVGFYAFGTGFNFFYRLFYALEKIESRSGRTRQRLDLETVTLLT